MPFFLNPSTQNLHCLMSHLSPLIIQRLVTLICESFDLTLAILNVLIEIANLNPDTPVRKVE